MKLLLSAYACSPGEGSEPEVGLRMMLAAAEKHSVWVLTRSNNVEVLSEFLKDNPHRARISIVGFDLGPRHLRLKKAAGRPGTIWYYDRWQKAIREMVANLDREHDFDLVHHITLATFWGRLGVSRLGKPLVVGPVGGAATSPISLFPVLGVSGMIGEIARRFIRPTAARVTGARRAQRRASAVIAQNHEAARAIGAPERTVVLPNGLIGATATELAGPQATRGERYVYAGRLVGWKGPMLAVRALSHHPSKSATLEFFGSGPLRRRLQREVERLELTDRVVFHGPVARQELVKRLVTSAALIHPALHDDSPLIIAEALSTGTPVVCLDKAGPPVIASYWPAAMTKAVPPSNPNKTARALARALIEVAEIEGAPDGSPAQRLTDEILQIYEQSLVQADRWSPPDKV